MKGLIVKDLINISKSIKIVLFLVVFYGVMALTTESPGGFTSIILLVLAMAMLSTYSYDEMVNWDIYALTLPITRDDIIQSKYMFMLIMSLLGFVLNCLSLIVINWMTKVDSVFDGVNYVALGTAIIILFYSILIPIITKVGITKARIYIIIFYMIPFAFGSFIFKQIKKISPNPPKGLMDFIEFAVRNVYIIVPLLIVFVLGISYYISIQIYRKKEF